MTTRVHELTQTQINRLTEQIESVGSRVDQLMIGSDAPSTAIDHSNVQTGVVGKTAATVLGPITSEDELSKRMQKELSFYQMIVDDIDMTMAKPTFDAFILQRLDAYREALCKARNACFEILFCLDISR
jgi:hypothetical protein